jgi:hypothetical protein
LLITIVGENTNNGHTTLLVTIIAGDNYS